MKIEMMHCEMEGIVMSRFEQYLGRNWSWENAVAKYAEHDAVPYSPHLPWVKDGHVEVESKSVAWNKEFVQQCQIDYKKARKKLEKKRAALLNEATEILKFVMWDELDRKLTDDDIDRYYMRFYDRYRDDGFEYMCSMIELEIDEIKTMDWFKDKPDYNYV